MSARDRRGEMHPDLLEIEAEGGAPRPDSALRARILGSVTGSLEGYRGRLARFFDLDLDSAGALLQEVAAPSAAWEDFPVPDVRLHHLSGGPRVANADCGLVRIAGGAAFPAHRHGADEWSLVLSGEAEEEDTGQVWRPGDLVHRPAGSVHAFRVTSEAPFVFAVVLDGEIELIES